MVSEITAAIEKLEQALGLVETNQSGAVALVRGASKDLSDALGLANVSGPDPINETQQIQGGGDPASGS